MNQKVYAVVLETQDKTMEFIHVNEAKSLDEAVVKTKEHLRNNVLSTNSPEKLNNALMGMRIKLYAHLDVSTNACINDEEVKEKNLTSSIHLMELSRDTFTETKHEVNALNRVIKRMKEYAINNETG